MDNQIDLQDSLYDFDHPIISLINSVAMILATTQKLILTTMKLKVKGTTITTAKILESITNYADLFTYICGLKFHTERNFYGKSD